MSTQRYPDWECRCYYNKHMPGSSAYCTRCWAHRGERRGPYSDCAACGRDLLFCMKTLCPGRRASPDRRAPSPDRTIKLTVDKDAPDGKSTCCVCLEREPIMVAVPCGHVAYCHTCSAMMQENPCALCRVPITSFIRVHLV